MYLILMLGLQTVSFTSKINIRVGGNSSAIIVLKLGLEDSFRYISRTNFRGRESFKIRVKARNCITIISKFSSSLLLGLRLRIELHLSLWLVLTLGLVLALRLRLVLGLGLGLLVDPGLSKILVLLSVELQLL